MRVRRLSLARLRDEEQGAVLMMVALSLVVLIGMAVLTFDLGRGVALKRTMVTAADAGALAAARECGLANGEASAKTAAGDLVTDNNGAAKVTGFKIDPSPAVCAGGANPDPDGHNTVTVTVTVPQEYFFAQIFGFDSGQVVASATAEWTLELSGPAPLKVEALKVDECLEGGDGLALLRGVRQRRRAVWMAQLPRGLAGTGRAQPPDVVPVHRRRERPERLHRADGGDGNVERFPADPVERPDLGVRQGRPQHYLCAVRSRIGSTPTATRRHRSPGRSSPSRWWRLRAVPAPRRAAGPGTGIRTRPTRSSGSRVSTSSACLCTGVEIEKEGLQDECGFGKEVPWELRSASS